VIPRRLVRTVPSQTTDEVESFWDHAVELHPNWEHVTLRDPIDPVMFPLTSKHWPACGSGAQLAGLIRLEDLYHRGGIYIDSDVELFRPLDSLLPLHAFAAWEDNNTAPDAVLGFEAHHPALRPMIAQALDSIWAGAWESGPGVTTRSLPARSDVLMLPPGSFFPVHWMQKQTLDDFDATLNPWTFGMHRWHASWPGSYQGG
jgi:hypothetical protein